MPIKKNEIKNVCNFKSESSHNHQPRNTRKEKTQYIDVRDIEGTQPVSHFKRLERKILRAKGSPDIKMHTCGKYKPFEPAKINMERKVDENMSHMLEVDYKAEIVRRGGKVQPKSGKYILVRGHKHYIEAENKSDYVGNRREQRNVFDPLNDCSGKKDKVNDPRDRKDKHIRREGAARRDCSADFKYDGKAVKRPDPNKPDLRYDVADINKKLPKFIPAELENDPDYLEWLNQQKNAAQFGPLRDIVEARIDRVAYFEDGRRVWNPQPEVEAIKNVENRRSKSPTRSVSRNRTGKKTLEKKTRFPGTKNSVAHQIRDEERSQQRSSQISGNLDFSQKRTIDRSRSRSRSRNTRSPLLKKPKELPVDPTKAKFLSQPVPSYSPKNNRMKATLARGERDFYLNNVERYKNMTKKKADFFARPVRTPDKSPRKFQPPRELQEKFRRDDLINQEIRLMQDRKKIIVRDKHKMVDDRLLRNIGILHKTPRGGRSRSPLRVKY